MLNENLDLDKSEFNYISPLDIKTEIKSLQCLKDLSESYLKLYQTTYEEDKLKLNDPNLTFNEKNCLLMIIGEKEILRFFIDFTAYCLVLFEINDTKEIKKRIKKDFTNRIFPYETYLNDVILQLVKTEHFK